MSNKMEQRYYEVKAEQEAVQKAVTQLAAKQAILDTELTRLSTVIEFRRASHQSVGLPLYNR